MRRPAANSADRLGSRVLVPSLIVILGLVGAYFQVGKLGISYLETEQLGRHIAVLRGTAPDPWAYRVLSELVLSPLLRLAQASDVAKAVPITFIAFRVVQNIAILSLAYAFYRRLGIGRIAALIGLAAITWSMTHALFDSDLAFNTYTDVALYLVGALVILRGSYRWLIPLVAIGTLNRETIVLLPLLLLAATYRPRAGWEGRVLGVAIICFAIGLMEYLGLRLLIGSRPLKLAYGNDPGLGLLTYNLFRSETWAHLAGTLSVFPVLAVVGLGEIPVLLRRWMLALVPIWFVVHLFSAVLAETRVLLVPQVLIFVPGALAAALAQGPPDPDFRRTPALAAEPMDGD